MKKEQEYIIDNGESVFLNEILVKYNSHRDTNNLMHYTFLTGTLYLIIPRQ